MQSEEDGAKMQNENIMVQEDEVISGKQKDDNRVKKQKKAVARFFIKLGVVCLVFWVIFTFIFSVGRVKGEAMYPRLRDGDFVAIYRIGKNYDIGNVVAFSVDGNERFARVVAKEGDIVGISEDSQLIVNGNVQTEEVHYPTEEFPGGIKYPYTVPSGSYFLLCDFRTQSSDSRNYGAVSAKEIRGKVITVLRCRGI